MLSICYLLFLTGLVRAGSLVQRPGVDDDCAKFCDVTYADKADQLESCKDGCRYFSFVQITGGLKDADSVKADCVKTCSEAYTDSVDLASACVNACGHQTPKTGQISIHFDENSRMKNKLSGPFDNMMSNFNDMFNWNKMMDSMWNEIPSSDDMRRVLDRMSSMMNFNKWLGGVKPELSDQGPDIPKIADLHADSDSPAVLTDDVKHLDPSLSADSPVIGNADEDGQQIILVLPLGEGSQFNAEDSTVVKDLPPHEPSPPVGIYVDDDWLACIGRRVRHLSYITRCMLSVALILSVISMIWICLAILRSSPRRRFSNLNIGKSGVEHVYYTTPPFTASDKAPMIIKTSDYKAQPISETPPPPYETTGEEKSKIES